MAIDLPQVKPGDLITAEFMTDLVGALADLDARIAALEGGGPATGAPQAVALTFQKAEPAGFDPHEETAFVFTARAAKEARLTLAAEFSMLLGITIWHPPLGSFVRFVDGLSNPLAENRLDVAGGVETPFSLVISLPDEKSLRTIWPKALDLEAPMTIRVTGTGDGVQRAQGEVRAAIGTGVIKA
jgi:hypothetical protein